MSFPFPSFFRYLIRTKIICISSEMTSPTASIYQLKTIIIKFTVLFLNSGCFYFYLFLERWEGREEETERNTDV